MNSSLIEFLLSWGGFLLLQKRDLDIPLYIYIYIKKQTNIKVNNKVPTNINVDIDIHTRPYSIHFWFLNVYTYRIVKCLW